MEQRSICLINDSFPPVTDGVANAVVNYAKILTENGKQATVVTPAYPGADDSQFEFPIVRYPSVDLTKLVGYHAGFPFSSQTLETLVKRNFDLIHCHCPVTSAMLARALRDRIHVPLVFTYHTKFDIDIANAIKGKLLQEEAKKVLVDNITACDEVWTVSHGAGENLRAIGYEGDYIVMPNGVDFPQGRVEDALIAQVTEGYDLPENVPVFLFVGRMMWYKGIRIILEGIAKLRESGQDFRMVFVGGGNDKDEIVALTEKLGLSDRVFFSPPIHDRNLIRAWYCRADMFLFPSTFDTNGLVVREAAACALGSVLVAGSCAAEDVTDNVSGVLIEENADSMAAKLEELCREPEAMKRIGEAAQRDIYISWEDAIGHAWERYAVVIDNYRAGKYPEHEGMSDEFFHNIAKTMDAYNRSREKQQARVNELRRGYAEIKGELTGEQEKLKENLLAGQAKIKDELAQFMERFM